MKKLINYLIEKRHPLAWALVIILAFSLLININYLWIFPGDKDSIFVVASIGVLMYGVYSAFMLFVSKNLLRDWNLAIVGFILVGISLIWLSMTISGRSWGQIGSFNPILKIIVVVSIIIMTMSISAKKVMEWIQSLDDKA
ncbi:MAG: hypothetical protein J5I59_00970 [Saprospiraceae bacterium]|nr:hypothetical protein [Saprospiraceae bacterium]